MLNVRLSREEENKLSDYSTEHNMSKTDIVKEALEMYFTTKTTNQSAFELGKDLFGLEGSGQEHASVSYKESLKKGLDEKHAH